MGLGLCEQRRQQRGQAEASALWGYGSMDVKLEPWLEHCWSCVAKRALLGTLEPWNLGSLPLNIGNGDARGTRHQMRCGCGCGCGRDAMSLLQRVTCVAALDRRRSVLLDHDALAWTQSSSQISHGH